MQITAKEAGDMMWKHVQDARADERERCLQIVRRICGETRHVKLGDRIVREIDPSIDKDDGDFVNRLSGED